jgi:hypothetical protein
MAALAMLIATTGGRPAAAQDSSLELPAFVAVLDRLLVSMPAASPESLPLLRDSIPAAWTVRHGDEQFDVSGVAIRRELDEGVRDLSAWPKRRETLVARLQEMRAEALRLSEAKASGVAPEHSRAALQNVLARKEFQRSASETVMIELRRRITEWLVRLWERFGGTANGGRTLAIVLAWTAALSALGALSWWLISTLLRSDKGLALAIAPPQARRRSAHAWARDAAAASDPRDVVRCAYRAAVTTLEDEGAWRTDDARTPREHLRLLPSGHRRRSLFADVARRFEEVWFGARTPTSEDTRTLLAQLKELGCLRAD